MGTRNGNGHGSGTVLREKHMTELLGLLASDTSTLVRKEVELARAELTERIDSLRDDMNEAIGVGRSEMSEKLDLAKSELSDKGKKAGLGLGAFGGAGIAAVLMLGALTACLILLLDRAMPTDLAALVVALVWGAVAAVAALWGRRKVQEATDIDTSRFVPRRTLAVVKKDVEKVKDPQTYVPEQTIETVKEDIEWAKTRIGSGKK
jgi:hypothetical protein